MAKILLVDDSITERTVVATALRGHDILEASNGDEGISMATKHIPDLILLDVVMPGKSGFQTCRELRRSPETESIPVIMLTSKDQDTDKQWGLRQGASEYLTKPFKNEELLKVVSQFL